MSTEGLTLPAGGAATAPGSSACGSAGVRAADYDSPEFQQAFVERAGGSARASLVVSGVTCGGCVARLERALQALPGIGEVDFNFSTSRLSLAWDHETLALSRILETLAGLGYQAYPFSRSSYRHTLDGQRRRMLRQLAVALVAGMQVMMLSLALYLGEAGGISEPMARFFRWAMLLLTLPVVLYSARAFLEPAGRALAGRRLTMDVPVSLGILVAFATSAVATARDAGAVYYDSVVMFVVLLLGARLLELGGRRRAAAATENMMSLAPEEALRLRATGDGPVLERVPAVRLAAGDRVRVLPGDRIPVDGRVLAGSGSVDRALLTGESAPAAVGPGSAVLGGALNTDGVIEIEVTGTGSATVLSRLLAMAARAQAEKPRIARLADRVAGRFVAFVLAAAAATGGYWWLAGDPAWISHLVTVLVVSCPCALSLAAPAAITAGTNAMLERGLLVVRADAVERMGGLTDVCLDKTGTLSTGRMRLAAAEYAGDLAAETCLGIAASLEQASRHPIAGAMQAAAGAGLPPAADLEVSPGRGVIGTVAGRRCVIGSPAFVAATAGLPPEPEPEQEQEPEDEDEAGAGAVAWLAADGRLQARFRFSDEPRPGLGPFVAALRDLGVELHILSGDHAAAVGAAARRLGVPHWRAAQQPGDKLAYLNTLRAGGARVAMLGDGINDAPVLAGADVAVAVDAGADVTKAGADAVLLARDLGGLPAAIALARRVRVVMGQNLGWAVLYNAAAIPLAAAGALAPWQAAIGMSASSLLVVGNALRLLR